MAPPSMTGVGSPVAGDSFLQQVLAVWWQDTPHRRSMSIVLMAEYAAPVTGD